MSTPIELALAWYSEDEWERWKKSVPDGDAFEESHKEWVQLAQGKIEEMAGRGYLIQKTPIRLDDFLAWCSARRCRADGDARSKYAAVLLRERKKESN